MTPQTTFATPYSPWKANPTHRQRDGVVAPIIIIEPVVVKAKKAPHTSRRGIVLEHIRKLGMASNGELVVSMGLPKYVIDCALKGLRAEGKVLVKNVPIVNRKPSHLYYAKS